MSEEQLKSFLEKVKTDTSLQEKLKAAAEDDVVVEIAKEAGFVFSISEIKTAQSAPQELSDEELEGVSGVMKVETGRCGCKGTLISLVGLC